MTYSRGMRVHSTRLFQGLVFVLVAITCGIATPAPRLLSRDRQSSEQFAGLNRRYDEMQAEFALVPLTISDTSQEEAL